MSSATTCPHCRTPLSARRLFFSGSTIHCPHCGQPSTREASSATDLLFAFGLVQIVVATRIWHEAPQGPCVVVALTAYWLAVAMSMPLVPNESGVRRPTRRRVLLFAAMMAGVFLSTPRILHDLDDRLARHPATSCGGAASAPSRC